MLSILCDRLTIKVKVGIPESFKVGWYPPKKTGSSHLKALQTGNGLVIRPTKTQCCGFLGTLLASIGVPLLLNALTGKGTQVDSTGPPSNTVSVYVPDTTNGHGMYNPYPYMSPPFFGTWENPVGLGVKKKRKGKGLLLGKNSPFDSIPILGTIL